MKPEITIQKELDQMLEQRDRIRQRQLGRHQTGSATRARTTTSNANIDKLQERIIWLREEIKRQDSV